MQAIFTLIIIAGAVVLLLLLPIFFNVSMYVNALENMGVVMLSAFGITLLCFQVKLNKTMLTIIKRKGKEKDIPLNPIDKRALFFEYFLKCIFRYTIFRHITLFLSIGRENDATATALGCGAGIAGVNSILAYLLTKKGTVHGYASVEPKFDRDTLTLLTKTSIVFNLFIILASLIRAKRLTKRWLYVYERFRKRA